MDNCGAVAGRDARVESTGHRPAAAESFERSTVPFLPDVLRFARSLTRDATHADDLVQETYLRALRGWHSFRDGADPRRWLFTICHHAFLRGLRREQRYVAAPDHDPELDSMETAVAHWQAQEGGVVERLDRMDLKPAIDRALGALAPHFRSAIVLVDVEGLSYEDAAAVLDVAVGTVRSRLFRGRRLLQDLLFVYAQDAGLASPPASRDPDTTPRHAAE
jgi:RNA polymerase sigma-70 factor, ECF subfamily